MSKKNKQLKNFEHNAKILQAAMVDANLTSMKIAAKVLKNELNGVEQMAHDDTSFADMAAHVLKTLAVAEAMIKHFKSLGVKEPSKKLAKQLSKVVAVGRALKITNMISGKSSTVKIPRIKRVYLDLSEYE